MLGFCVALDCMQPTGCYLIMHGETEAIYSIRRRHQMQRPTNLKLGTQMEHEDSYHYSAITSSQGQRSKSQGHVMRLTVLVHKYRTKSCKNTKMGRKVA